MKSLIDILEKLDINTVRMSPEIPENFNYDDMYALLCNNRFKEIDYVQSSPDGTIGDRIPIFNNKRGKYFMISSYKEFFIADTSKGDVSKKNPMIYIEWNYQKPNNRRIAIWWGKGFTEYENIDEKKLYKYLHI